MPLKTDPKTLTKELKKAAKSGAYFVYAPSGEAKKPAVLMLSKKNIPVGERKIAKSTASAKKVYFGTCIKEGQNFIFKSEIKPPSTLGKTIKGSIKELSNLTPPAVEVVFAGDVAKQKRAEEAEEDAKKKDADKKAKPKKVSNSAVLNFMRKSTGYKNLKTKEFVTLVKGKDSEFFKMFDQLKEALATGDTKKVKAIAKMKIKHEEKPQE